MPHDFATSMVKKTRKTHSKSRNGCKSCKKLRVKCDELRPSCSKCKATGRPCQYFLQFRMEYTADKDTGLVFNKNGGHAIAVYKEPKNSHLLEWSDGEELEEYGEEQVERVERCIPNCTSITTRKTMNGTSVQITSYEQKLLRFFYHYGATVTSLGFYPVEQVWSGPALNYSLHCDMLFNSMMAISSLLCYKRGILKGNGEHDAKSLSRSYYHKAVALCRSNLARPRNEHDPLALAASSYLIFAYALINPEMVPVLSWGGGLDLYGMAPGPMLISDTYTEELRHTFYLQIMGERLKASSKIAAVVAPSVEYPLIDEVERLVSRDAKDAKHRALYLTAVNEVRNMVILTGQHHTFYFLACIPSRLDQRVVNLARNGDPPAILIIVLQSIATSPIYYHTKMDSRFIDFVVQAGKILPESYRHIIDLGCSTILKKEHMSHSDIQTIPKTSTICDHMSNSSSAMRNF